MILLVKLSGKVLEERTARRRLCGQIAELVKARHRIAAVHGGGKQLTRLADRLGIETVQHQGRRVTDPATLELAVMVFSALNRSLVADLTASGLPALGMAAFDAGLTSCRRRPPMAVVLSRASGEQATQLIDFGLVGEIQQINATVISRLWESGFLPVISCLGADGSGQILNINADTLAAELAIALDADRLISASDVEGVFLDAGDHSAPVPELTAAQAREYLKKGRFTDGMVPKVEAALKVLDRGVGSVQIVSGFRENALVQAVAGKSGTLLRK